MTLDSLGGETPVLFMRKATGLVRGWSVRDSVIYSCLATNVITLGIYEFSFQSFVPRGQLLTSVLISGIWVSFLVIAYAGLVVTIPRAGGDYIWQSRIFGSGVGFVMAATGWWFILWLWAPIYGNILSVELFQPLWATLGDPSGAAWFASDNGIFVVSLITILLAGVMVSIGMTSYAKIQKWCFYGGLAGFAIIIALLMSTSHATFVSSVNQEAHAIFGVNNAYETTEAAAAKIGYSAPSPGVGPLGASMLLVPMMMFYLLWPNWGSTLYGEIRGARDFRRVFTGMFSGLWLTIGLSVIFLLAVTKTFGHDFYNNANAVYWSHATGGAVAPAIPIWPHPVMLTGWLVHNTAFQVGLLLLMSLWFVGWVGTLFLSSTRVIFAIAFDRVLPDSAAAVSEKRKVPTISLALMLLPAVGLSAVYAYSANFATYTLDATLVIAATYLISAVGVVVLPWRRPDLWRASPASRIRVMGVPVVPAAGVITVGLLVFNLYEWLTNSAYGVNNSSSLLFMAGMYALAVVVYLVARTARSRQGIDLSLANQEIPVE